MQNKHIIQWITIIILMVAGMITAQTNKLESKETLMIDNSTNINNVHIEINIEEQKLYLQRDSVMIQSYPISSSKFGIGSKANSNKTPLGKHEIKKRYGKNAPLGTIFKSRANTGTIAEIHKDLIYRETDLVTTRIMWLTGLEKSNNNSYNRYIYIHGTPEEGLIGTPASHGCIRMKNDDVIELFKKVKNGTQVNILSSTSHKTK